MVRWYAARGYDFVVLTDHNVVSPARSVGKTRALLGSELTANLRECVPAAEPGFGCPLHVNALVLGEQGERVGWPPSSDQRTEIYRAALGATRSLGGVAQLNHPNFHYAAGAELLVSLSAQGLRLVEVANLSSDSNNAGDSRHPDTEALWDAALSQGATLFGTATDDAHHFDDAERRRQLGEEVFTGDLGWVMVRARNEPASIRAALSRGEFYSSSGVSLRQLEVVDGALVVAAASEAPVTFRFIGLGGKVLQESRGTSARFQLSDAAGGYVRAVVTDQDGRRAWVQPVRVPGR